VFISIYIPNIIRIIPIIVKKIIEKGTNEILFFRVWNFVIKFIIFI